MKEILKQLILDFHAQTIPVGIDRRVNIAALPSPVRKAQVFIGMRRVGKTWLLYQYMKNLLALPLVKEKILYINFEDDRLSAFKVENFQQVLEAYFDLYPQYADASDLHFCFDEIQTISGWEKFIRRLLDKEKMHIFITGSSAKMLSKELATSLRGRCLTTEVFPLNFREYVSYHLKTVPKHATTKDQSQLRFLSRQYLKSGGFPETIFLDENLHRETIQDYVNTAIFRDVIERYQIKAVPVVKRFLSYCLQNVAAPLSISKVYQVFKSQGEIVGKNSLYEYVHYFEDAYLLFTVPLYDFSVRKRQVNPTKIYVADPGIIHAYSIKPLFELSSCLENAVFNVLRYQQDSIFYYKTKTGKEIDFVYAKKNGERILFQVALNLKEQSTREREISALIEASDELEISSLHLITLEEEENIEKSGKTIQVMPYWKWALSFESNVN